MNLLAQTQFAQHPLFPMDHPLFGILIAFDIALRGFALYKAARNNSPVWFVALLIVNSLGILPIIYLVFFAQKPASPVSTAKTSTTRKAPIKPSKPKTKK